MARSVMSVSHNRFGPSIDGEVAPHLIDMDRRPGLHVFVTAFALAEHAPPAACPGRSTRRSAQPLTHRSPGPRLGGAMAELGIVVVSVEQGVGLVCLDERGVGAR